MKPPLRVQALYRAITFLGTKEHPAGSNHGPRIDRWCERVNGIPGGYPWCAAFLWCMFDDVDKKLRFTGPALVENWVKWGKEQGYIVERPLRGDVCCFDWDSNGWRDHIGIVEKVRALRWRGGRFVGWVTSIEGNTALGADSDGGQVQRRRRWVNGRQVYIRIPD